jgi:hypothetical protein
MQQLVQPQAGQQWGMDSIFCPISVQIQLRESVLNGLLHETLLGRPINFKNTGFTQLIGE